MDYVYIILGFAATLVATLGKTKDSTKEGFSSVTRLGWLALLISTLMVVLMLLKTYSESKKKIEEDKFAILAELTARQALSSNLRKSLDGLDVLYRQCSAGTSFSRISDLKEDRFIKCLTELNVQVAARDPAFVDHLNPNLSIALTMNKASIAGRDIYWKNLQNYKDYLNKGLMLSATEFYNLPVFGVFDDSALIARFPETPITIMERDSATHLAMVEMIDRAISLEAALSNPSPSMQQK